MSKITTLSSVLIDKFGLTQEDADTFVATMFEVIKDSLLQGDRTVKIKKLGTFKVTSVSSRESIDINSGERITIEARNKISFTPETSLKDRVNKPFSQFETVDINDGVDFADLKEETLEQPETPSMAMEEPTNTDAKVIPSTDETSLLTEQESTPLTDETALLTEQESTLLTEENIPLAEENAPLIPEQELDEPETTASEQVENTVIATEKPKNDAAETLILQYQEHERRKQKEQVINNKRKLRARNIAIIVLSILLFLVLAVAAYALYTASVEMKKKDSRIVDLEILIDEMSSKDKANDAFKTSETTEQQANDTLSTNKEALNSPVEDTKTQTNKAESSNKEKSIDEVKNADYNKDPRIRTGAYIVTGIAQTVVLQKGQTLKSISRAYLGDGMECYVEAVNNKKEYKEGEVVNIPALKLKPKRTKK